MRWFRSASVMLFVLVLLVGDAYSGDEPSSSHEYFPSRFWPYLRKTQSMCIRSEDLGNTLGEMSAIMSSAGCDALYRPYDYDSEVALRHMMDVAGQGILASKALIRDLSACKPADCLKPYHGHLMSTFQTIRGFYNYLYNCLSLGRCASLDSCDWYSRRMNWYVDDATASFLEAKEKCLEKKGK